MAKGECSPLTKLQRKVARAKRRCRSELDYYEWSRHKFYKQTLWLPQKAQDPFDKVSRIDYASTTTEEFIHLFEKPCLPVVIQGIADSWETELLSNKKELIKYFGHQKFKVGESDSGNSVYMKLKYFFKYCETDALTDDSPLYIFDSRFADCHQGHPTSTTQLIDGECNSTNKMLVDSLNDCPILKKSLAPSKLLDLYSVPKYFAEDLFRLAGERRRPPYRWIVIGPPRSGTGIHIDPLGTSAWNTLLTGHKRWCLFPPNTPKDIIDPKMPPGLDREAVTWFHKVLPMLKGDSSNTELKLKCVSFETKKNCKTYAEQFGMIEILQKPGETVFVPGGWHHVVVNLDFTIAITQNYCSSTNLEYVWLNTRFSRPKLAEKLYNEIRQRSYQDKEVDTYTNYCALYEKLQSLHMVPAVEPSSSSSSDSSSSSSSSQSSSEDRNCNVKDKFKCGDFDKKPLKRGHERTSDTEKKEKRSKTSIS